jgi:hypothetical protein
MTASVRWERWYSTGVYPRIQAVVTPASNQVSHRDLQTS